jgi:DNA-directed RNA polymerase subunit beta
LAATRSSNRDRSYPYESSGLRKRLSFGKIAQVLPLPDLIATQRESYERFRTAGIAETLKEISPIEEHSGRLMLEFGRHSFGEPKYSIDECKSKGMTYSEPLEVEARLINRETGEIKEEVVSLGEIPMMTPQGTFIVHGTERVVVSQLVRSPGVYFGYEEDKQSGQQLPNCKIIPARGAWLEFDIDKRKTLGVKVDRKRRAYATTFLRALGLSEADMFELFQAWDAPEEAQRMLEETLSKEGSLSFEDSLVEIYRRVRPGDPPNIEQARYYIEQMFFSQKRYDLARVGRYKVNKKLEPEFSKLSEWFKKRNLGLPDEKTYCLTLQDVVATVTYLVALELGEDGYDVDDIDHFGNRRVRPVGELMQNVFRQGLARMERLVREKMSTQDAEALTPRALVNSRPVVAALKEFFGSSQLSQFMDQTNPLAGITHKRRLSALGPGGLSRERAGFDVRDVHPSHYGRMCPIETPEGPSIGLIGSLSTYARINEYGFVETPYRKVVKGRVTDEIHYLTADEEDKYVIAQANAEVDENGKFIGDRVLVRKRRGDVHYVSPTEVDYQDVSPSQIVSVAAALIPFLEHDDPNRALMGANMQRQAVPLIRTEAPYVGTGVEARAALDGGSVVVAEAPGTVTEVTADYIKVDEGGKERTYRMVKFRRSNQGTCINQRPIVKEGDRIKQGQIIADGPSTDHGELALGRNLLVAFMPWEGHNFEDAIVISERLVTEDILTSIHIEEYEVEARDTKLGAEEITADIPNVAPELLADLDDRGIIRVGAEVQPGDYLVGKVTPKGETELTPEERLLQAIFGEKAKEVRDTSLRVPHGESGKVIGVEVFTRETDPSLPPGVNQIVRVYVAQKRKVSVGDKLAGRHGNKGVIAKILPVEDMPFLEDGTPVDIILNPLGVPSRMNLGQVLETHLGCGAHFGWEGGPGSKSKETLPGRGEPAAWVKSPAFDGAKEEEIFDILKKLNPGRDGKRIVDEQGKAVLYDGRTGEPYDHKVTVGYTYVMKLLHLVDDKIHARSTGPYSMITQQPLGGKAQFGGQRFGEMEVWALEAYGAAHALQELLTVKSDDTFGRVHVYEALVKGENVPEPGIPESFKVLLKEMQSLCLDVEVFSNQGELLEMKEPEEDVFRSAEELGINLTRPERTADTPTPVALGEGEDEGEVASASEEVK